MPARLDHVTVVTDHFEASRSVYEPVLAALGLLASVEYTDPEAEDADPGEVAAAGFGRPDSPPLLWLGLLPGPGRLHHPGPGGHRGQVRGLHRRPVAGGQCDVRAGGRYQAGHQP